MSHTQPVLSIAPAAHRRLTVGEILAILWNGVKQFYRIAALLSPPCPYSWGQATADPRGIVGWECIEGERPASQWQSNKQPYCFTLLTAFNANP